MKREKREASREYRGGHGGGGPSHYGKRQRRDKNLERSSSRPSERDREADRSRGKRESHQRDRSRPSASSKHKYSTRSQDDGWRRGDHRERAKDADGRSGGAKAKADKPSTSCRENAPEPASTSYSSYRFLQNKLTPPWRSDDEDGHYRYDLGENFTKRYKILSHLGEGTFGKVIECWDRLHEQYVAIKVIRSVPKYRTAGMLELAVLNTVRKQQQSFSGGSHCVHFREWFDYRGHICIVFSKLGLSLFDLLRKNRYRPFDLFHVQTFAKQMLETVDFLHKIKLIHTDLKPENILLPTHKYYKVQPPKGSKKGKRVPEKAELYLIDFGSATFEDQHHSKIVSTRHYRAPEVVLGLGWSYPCDIWSLGCILVELVTGEALFKMHDNLEHLAMMEKVLGRVPSRMVAKILSSSSHSGAPEYFDAETGDLAWPERCKLTDSVQAVSELKDLRQLVEEKGDASIMPHVDDLVDLIRGLLLFDPERRMTASQGLQHKFFTLPVPRSS